MVRSFLTSSALALTAAAAWAGPTVNSEVKVGEDLLSARGGDVLEQAAGDRVGVTAASLRLKYAGQNGTWSWETDYLAEGLYSSRYIGLASLTRPPPARNFLHLDDGIAGGVDGTIRQRIDRGWVARTTASTVIRIGRQALTWGHGTVFRPMDLFNPFSPDATDMSYKPGADMIYGQYLFDSGADIQLLAIPRKDATGDFRSSLGSYAVKGFWMNGSVETDIVAARDYGATVIAAGASGPIGGALWKADVVVSDDGGDTAVSAVASFQNSWSIGKRPATGFVEYYRNGFGVTDRRPVADLPAALTERIARGQVFATGRDYVALGGTLDWTPLLTIAPTLIVNLHDGSRFAIASVDLSVSDSVSLIAGLQIPAGRRGTEYGGRAVTSGATIFDRPPDRLFVRVEKYF